MAVTAVSPSLAGDERDDCAALAAEWGLRWVEVETDEMDRRRLPRNDGDRCFHCKDALMDAVGAAGRRPRARPWCSASTSTTSATTGPGSGPPPSARRRFPLVEAGFTKADVRAASRALGLRTWDKPAAACLASRVPYGTPVSVGVLGRVERAEAALRAPGLRRAAGAPLRRHGPPRGAARRPGRGASSARAEVVDAVRGAGYRYVTLDLEGLRSGNLNQALADAGRSGG